MCCEPAAKTKSAKEQAKDEAEASNPDLFERRLVSSLSGEKAAIL